MQKTGAWAFLWVVLLQCMQVTIMLLYIARSLMQHQMWMQRKTITLTAKAFTRPHLVRVQLLRNQHRACENGSASKLLACAALAGAKTVAVGRGSRLSE